MKLKNKKTGEIVDTLCQESSTGIAFGIGHHDGNPTMAYYNSLAELNEEWEDYEEPKGYYYVTTTGLTKYDDTPFCAIHKDRKEIGNYFETKEEAEKAVEKLKAWKRLKDKGFRFTGLSNESIGYEIKELSGDFALDLDLLFNGGEE